MSANNAIYVVTVIEKSPAGYSGGKPYGERQREIHFVCENDVDMMGELTQEGKATQELFWNLLGREALHFGTIGAALECARQKALENYTEYGICCATVEYQHQ